MTISASSANFVDAAGTAQNPTIVLPSNVPAGATIVVGIWESTDETTTVSSVTDPVNGAWGASPSGPTRLDGASTGSTWLYYIVNSAALSTVGNRTITVNFNGSVTYALGAGWFADDSGNPMTFDEFAAVRNVGTGETNVDSNTVTADGAGAVMGLLVTTNQQTAPEPTADGAGESKVSTAVNTARVHFIFEAYASSGTYRLETTIDNSASMFHVAAFLEPSTDQSVLIGGKLVGGGLLIGGALVN